MNHAPKCVHCQEEMHYETITQKDMGLQFFGALLGLGGIAAIFFIPFPVGLIVGLLVLLLAARMGYSKKTGWHCHNCGYFFNSTHSN